MKRWFVIISLIIFFPASMVTAAPAPWGLALNHETKECAGFWAGDEFTGYGLPEGWKAYYPIYESGAGGRNLWGKIQTEAGECGFQMRKEEACCMELGYRFVSDNIGKGQTEKLRDRIVPERKAGSSKATVFWVVIIVPAAVAIFFLIRHSLKKRRAKNSEENEHGNNSNEL